MTEHDAWFDHAGLYDCGRARPTADPGARAGIPARRIDAMVALVDIMPTVLELQDMPARVVWTASMAVPSCR